LARDGSPNNRCVQGFCQRIECQNRDCGDDGTGQSCGTCPAPSVCVNNRCCKPDCTGRICGDDGCGGSCGSCGNLICVGGTQCQAACVPDCSGRSCGPDPVCRSRSCGDCSLNQVCDDGVCRCRNDGESCSRAENCCGSYCYNGRCRAACLGLGDFCTRLDECGCGRICSAAGRCATTSDPCLGACLDPCFCGAGGACSCP
jgi:hypothetical protein